MRDNKHPICKTISIGLIGPGLIGSTLLQQIHHVTKAPNANAQVNFHVYGIMKSKQMLLSHHPVNQHAKMTPLGGKTASKIDPPLRCNITAG